MTALIPRIEALVWEGRNLAPNAKNLPLLIEALDALKAASNLSLAAKIATECGMFETGALEGLDHAIEALDETLKGNG